MEKNVELWEKKVENQIFKKSNEKKIVFSPMSTLGYP